jgi:hypothetical protein
MAYETGNASNIDNLLQALATFASAQGWTISYNGDRTGTGAGLGTCVIISKGGTCHTNFRTTNSSNTITTAGQDPYNASLTTEQQTNSSSETTDAMTGPFQAYHFFAGNTYFYAVVETQPGIYKHFGCGILEKYGTVSPGHFIYGCDWDYTQNPAYINDPFSSNHLWPFENGGRLRVDYDGNTNLWSTTANRLGFYPSSRSTRLNDVSAYTQRSVFAAPIWYLDRPNSYASMVGIAPGIRCVLLNWIAPGDSLTFGSDVWKVFPVIKRNGAAGEPNSGLYGFAFKV